MKDSLNICIFYLCVHKRIDEKVGLSRLMLKGAFYKMLGEVYHIPKPLRVVILKEMMNYNMIEEDKTDKRIPCIKVKPLLTDPEENINKFYREIGLWD